MAALRLDLHFSRLPSRSWPRVPAPHEQSALPINQADVFVRRSIARLFEIAALLARISPSHTGLHIGLKRQHFEPGKESSGRVRPVGPEPDEASSKVTLRGEGMARPRPQRSH